MRYKENNTGQRHNDNMFTNNVENITAQKKNNVIY